VVVLELVEFSFSTSSGSSVGPCSSGLIGVNVDVVIVDWKCWLAAFAVDFSPVVETGVLTDYIYEFASKNARVGIGQLFEFLESFTTLKNVLE
jgi:hypothetical protein